PIGIFPPLARGDAVFAQDIGAIVRQLLDLLCRSVNLSAGGSPRTHRGRQYVLSRERHARQAAEHECHSERENKNGSLTLHPISLDTNFSFYVTAAKAFAPLRTWPTANAVRSPMARSLS